MGEAAMDRLSDRGSTPLNSIRKMKRERLDSEDLSPFLCC